MSEKSIFATRFSELCKGTTQQEIADAIGVTRVTISYYQRDERSPDIKTLAKIAKYFGVTSDYLIGLSDARKAESADIVERLGLSESNIEKFENLKKFACEDKTEAISSGPHIIDTMNDIITELFEHDIWIAYADLCDVILNIDSNKYAQWLLNEEPHNLAQIAQNYGCTLVDSVQNGMQQISTFITICNLLVIDLVQKYNDVLEEKKAEAYRIAGVQSGFDVANIAERLKNANNH